MPVMSTAAGKPGRNWGKVVIITIFILVALGAVAGIAVVVAGIIGISRGGLNAP